MSGLPTFGASSGVASGPTKREAQMSSRDVRALRVAEVFDGTRQFRVPIYQRAYAWGQDEIHALLQDVKDSLDKGVPAYYIGSLVVSSVARVDERARFDVIDGQ